MLHHHSMAAAYHKYHILSIVWFRIIWLTAASATSPVQVRGLVTGDHRVSLGCDPEIRREVSEVREVKLDE